MAEQHALLEVARQRQPNNPRLQHCQRTRISAGLPVSVEEGTNGRYLTNVQTCGQIICPVCGPRIMTRRAAETARLAANAADHGMGVYLVTLTHGHDITDALVDLLNAQNTALSHLNRGKGALKTKLGAVGARRALDILHGDSNGWHPHQHVALLLPDQRPAAELRTTLQARWDRSARHAGLRVQGDAVQVSDITETPGGAGYLFKSGIRPDDAGQHSRTLYQLLRAAAAGDVQAGLLWDEAVSALKGRRITVTTPTLKHLAQLRADGADLSTSASGVPVFTIPPEDWRTISPQKVRELLTRPTTLPTRASIRDS